MDEGVGSVESFIRRMKWGRESWCELYMQVSAPC